MENNNSETIISTRSPSDMTEAEKKKECKKLRARLKVLKAAPRSDWHREFEDAVQLTIEAWNVGAWTIREHELGEDSPRTDLIVVTGNGLPPNVEDVFSFFLLHNVLEFKGPGDKLDRNTLRKVAGYGHFFISTAKKTENIAANNVTLSVFASEIDENEFAEMLEEGTLTTTDISGVYSVSSLSDIPFHVVLIGELKGEAYAAYRVLKKHAELMDVDVLLDELRKADEGHDQNKMDRLHRILNLVEIKNHGAVVEKIQEDLKMKSVFLDILKPDIDKVVNSAVDTAVNNAVNNTTRTNLYIYVQDGDMMLDRAAQRAGMSIAEFSNAMSSAGYTVPQSTSK